MRLTVLAYIGNEEDIVEAFVRHHAALAERIICITTGTDRTEHILRQLAAEGLPLDIRPHLPAYHDQHEALSAIMRDESPHSDWIIPLDADEFLQGDVQAAFRILPTDKPVLLPWRTYVPVAEDKPGEPNVLLRIMHRRDEEQPQFRKVLVPAGIARESSGITRGNHALQGVPGEKCDALTIAHFPVRTSAQFLHKVTSGWQAVLRNPDRLPEEAAHWRAMHERYAQRDALDARELQNIALRYAMAPETETPALIKDPVPCTFTLRYTA